MAGRNAPWVGKWKSIGIAEARSALAWWLEAGVDVAIQEEPRNWLKAAASRATSACREPAEPPNIVQPSHETLAELQRMAREQRQSAAASATAQAASFRTGLRMPPSCC